MAQKHILVCFDNSDLASKALEYAADLARHDEEIVLDIVFVAAVPELSGEAQEKFGELLEMLESDCHEVLYQAQDRLENLSGRFEMFLLKGSDPATELLKLIKSKDYYMAVMGSRGFSTLKGYLGSVSFKVLQHAEIPLLIVK